MLTGVSLLMILFTVSDFKAKEIIGVFQVTQPYLEKNSDL